MSFIFDDVKEYGLEAEQPMSRVLAWYLNIKTVLNYLDKDSKDNKLIQDIHLPLEKKN